MRYYIARTGRAVLTMWAAVTLTFGITRLLPGGPLEQIANQIKRNNPRMSEAQVQSIVADRAEALNINVDAPLHVQYVEYVASLATGDLGMSLQETQPVSAIVGEALPWTLFVMTTATVVVFAVAIVWGATIAYREGGRLDTASSSLSILASAVPFYILAFVLILVFGYRLGWLPVSGRMSGGVTPELSLAFVADALAHALLPILSVVLTQTGLQTLAMRGNSIQVLGQDYVQVARLRGLADNRIATRYVARNAILPMYTGFLTLIGFNLGASIILEQVFNYRGLGFKMFQGLTVPRDYPLVMGTFLVYTVALVLAVYVADLTYGQIDPRVKRGDVREAY